MDKAKVWAIKSNQWEETDNNLSPPSILKENNKAYNKRVRQMYSNKETLYWKRSC
jgi:nitrogen fixation-related uncharacterized protein